MQNNTSLGQLLRVIKFKRFILLNLDKDDVLEDADYEKGILESTKIYEVEETADGDTELVHLDQYAGKVPSKKWLLSDKVILAV